MLVALSERMETRKPHKNMIKKELAGKERRDMGKRIQARLEGDSKSKQRCRDLTQVVVNNVSNQMAFLLRRIETLILYNAIIYPVVSHMKYILH